MTGLNYLTEQIFKNENKYLIQFYSHRNIRCQKRVCDLMKTDTLSV